MSNNSPEDGNSSSPNPDEEPLEAVHNTPPNGPSGADEITLSDESEGEGASRDPQEA